MTIEQIETMVETIHTFGELSQQVKAMEELGELIQAIAKVLSSPRHIDNGPEVYHLSEEMADVEIMLEQLKIIYRLHDRVATWRTLKLGRLRNRIDREEGRKSDG